jgi:hypothetical protein
MAQWIMINSISLSFGKGVVVLEAGDTVDDSLYNMTQIQGAGGQFIPASDVFAANLQTYMKKQARYKGNRNQEAFNQPFWGLYARKGQITITGTNTSGVLALSPVELDTNYFVTADITASSGANTVLCPISSVSKNTGNVTINLQASPGAANSVTFDIVLFR